MRVVLVEITTPPRFHSNLSFPFVKGGLDAAGIPCRWLRFTYPPDIALRSVSQGATFPPEDVRRLIELVQQEDTTHVLLGVMPSESLVRALHEQTPECRIGAIPGESGEVGLRPGGDEVAWLREGDQAEIVAWLGLAGGGAEDGGPWFGGGVSPSYAWEPANERAATVEQPPAFVQIRPECTYRAPLSRSTFFREAGDATLPPQWGCSFCTSACFSQTQPKHSSIPLEEDLERQLEAVLRTHPPTPGLFPIRINGARAALSPMTLVAVLDRLNPRPCRFLFDYRADYLVARESDVRDAVAALGERGHRFEIALMGLESFSLSQLDRYHKGYGPTTNLRAVRILREIEADHGEHFSYEGLSTILFDPWCSFGDIALTIEACKQLQIMSEAGKLFTSRLRLYDALPLATVARRDELLIAEYEDPLLDTARRNFYADELPWRFRDPRIEAVNRILTRLLPEPGTEADRLSADLQDLVKRTGIEPAEVATAAVEVAVEETTPLSPRDILERIRARHEREQEVAEDEETRVADLNPFVHLPELAAFKAGLKPVIKLEGRPDEAQDALIAKLREAVGGLHVVRRERGENFRLESEVWDTEIFASKSRAHAEEAAKLTSHLESLSRSKDREACIDTVTRVGVLLGYPECCARAYAEREDFYGGQYEYQRLLRRVEQPGPVAAAMTPQILSFVPCRMDCPEATALAEKVLEAKTAEWREELERHPDLYEARFAHVAADGDDPKTMTVEDLLASDRKLLDYPRLRFLSHEVHTAVLEPLDPPEESSCKVGDDAVYRFRYRYRNGQLGAADSTAIMEGDEIEVAPGLVRIFKEGVERWVSPLDAYLWYPQQAFHPEFWRELLAAPVFDRGVVASESEGVPLADEQPEQRKRIRAAFEHVVSRLIEHRRELIGDLRVVRFEDGPYSAAWGIITLRATLDEHPLVLHVVPHETPEPRFRETARFAIFHDPDTPADSPEAMRLMDLLVRGIERVVPDA